MEHDNIYWDSEGTARYKKGCRQAVSCWGCGFDYCLSVVGHSRDDLVEMYVYGVKEFVCPDCYDELPEDYDTKQLNLI